MRHVAIKYHFVRERSTNGDIALEHVGTTDCLADLATKCLPTTAFTTLRDATMNVLPD